LVFSQTANISSDDEVCLNELISFEAVVTGTATLYTWDLGDNTSSTQKNPSHIFSSVGTKTISLTVTFSGGGSQSSTKTITVHDLPSADFSLDTKEFCLYSQGVCLEDKSTMGSTTTGYSSRLILWGDGAQTSSSFPGSNPITCYSSYPKSSTSPYTIIVEVQNDKGCEDKWQEDIYILDDYKPRFTYRRQPAACDSQVVCFTNDSTVQRADIESFSWDFGDGNTQDNEWGRVCHTYSASGTYRAVLSVKLKNGCVSTFSRVLAVNLYDFKVEPEVSDTVVCYPNTFNVRHTLLSGAKYTWQIYDEDTAFIANAGFGIVDNLSVPCPGYYFMRLEMKVGNCTRYSRFFKLDSRGVAPQFLILNKNQCVPQDTVYTFNTSKVHPEANPVYTWEFNDSNVIANCNGWRNNCNTDSDTHSRHFYEIPGCYEIRLLATDLVSGCSDEYIDSASIIDPSELVYTHQLNRPCLGFKGEYAVNFSVNACYGDFEICVDSLSDDTLFTPLRSQTYYSVADSLGWVTVGFAHTIGSSNVYHSPDTSDYSFEPDNVCRDTTWFHNWFQLFPEPEPELVFNKDSICLPVKLTISYDGEQESKLRYFKYRWTDGSVFEIDTLNGILNPVSYIFTEEVNGKVTGILEDSNGCYVKQEYRNTYGYHNSIDHEPIICINQKVIFRDSVRYYGDLNDHWNNPLTPETVTWDFDDGNGFQSLGKWPIVSYDSIGVFDVRLASVDKNGCRDTAYSQVLVGNIIAAMQDNSDQYLCDQIIQFFDSSYFSFPNSVDKIIEYFWDFGDNTTPSFLEDPFHYYSSNGAFIVTLAVETEAGCKDTAEIPIYLKGPEPFFELISDSVGCVPFTASFQSNSKLVSAYNWYLGDQNNTLISTQTDTIIHFTYNQPGTYYIRLEGSDSFVNASAGNTYTCSATFPDTASGDALIKVVVLPVPQASFNVKEPICVGQKVILEHTSDSIYISHRWRIDDHYNLTDGNYEFTFEKAGQYEIEYTPTYIAEGAYERECFDSAENTVTVNEVLALFGVEENGQCNEYLFIDSSVNAVNYSWNFGQPSSGKRNTSEDSSPSHSYGRDSGTFVVTLIVVDVNGCIDTTEMDVESSYFRDLIPYNVFTPDDDSRNDEFIFDIVNHSSYDLSIFNRYGERVFRTSDPLIGWNGKEDNLGDDLPASTYFYVLKYKFNCDNTPRIKEGIVELLR